MSLTSLKYILLALQSPFSQTGVTNTSFRTDVLPNDTFADLKPVPDLAARCANFTTELDNQVFTNFNSCIATANATYDIRLGNVSDALVHNLELVGVSGSSSSKRLADNIMTHASDTMLFFCNVTRCNSGRDSEREDDGGGLCLFRTLFPYNQNATAGDQRMQMSDRFKDVCRNRICDAVATRVSNDPDIGGIGVFMSYFQQVAICLIIFGNLVVHNVPMKSNKRALSLSRKYSMFNSNRWCKSSNEFIDFGFDFHKAQVWFLSTLMIASYIRRATEDISIVNSYMLLNIALNGVGLLSFTLLLLALLKRDRVDCFIMYMTSLAYWLCFAFMIYIMYTSRTEVPDWLNAAKFCDGRIVPQLVPQHRWDAVNAYIKANEGLHRRYYVVVMIFCTLVLVFTEFLVRLRWNVKKYYDNGHKLITISVSAFVIIGYILVFFMQLWLMGLFTKLASVIWQNQWGFGQIVAVTLWVPIIADYFWSKFQKEKDHLRHLQPPEWAKKIGLDAHLRGKRDSADEGPRDMEEGEGKSEQKDNVDDEHEHVEGPVPHGG